MDRCLCKSVDREDDESMRDWMKRWMCAFHWMQTDFYQNKLILDKANAQPPRRPAGW